MAQFRSKPFGVTKNGDKVDEYIISNPGGLEISVLNYGCVIKNLFVPTKTGPVDVVVGHDTLADYEADFNSSGSTCCGAFVGRYANRIENAEFSLSGKTYKLEANNGKNHLHGTFPRKIYDVKMFGDTLLMETESPAGEDGFPGNLKVSVRYILTPDNTLRMDYRVSTDEDTIINPVSYTHLHQDGKRAGSFPQPDQDQWCLRPPDVLPGLRGERLRVPEQHHAHGGQHGAHPGRSGDVYKRQVQGPRCPRSCHSSATMPQPEHRSAAFWLRRGSQKRASKSASEPNRWTVEQYTSVLLYKISVECSIRPAEILRPYNSVSAKCEDNPTENGFSSSNTTFGDEKNIMSAST